MQPAAHWSTRPLCPFPARIYWPEAPSEPNKVHASEYGLCGCVSEMCWSTCVREGQFVYHLRVLDVYEMNVCVSCVGARRDGCLPDPLCVCVCVCVIHEEEGKGVLGGCQTVVGAGLPLCVCVCLCC